MKKRELLWWLVFGASSLAAVVGIMEGFERPSSVVVFLMGPVLMVTLSGVFLLEIIPRRRDDGK